MKTRYGILHMTAACHPAGRAEISSPWISFLLKTGSSTIKHHPFENTHKEDSKPGIFHLLRTLPYPASEIKQSLLLN